MRRSGLNIMSRLIVLLGPLVPVMLVTIVLGVLGFLVAIAITVLGGYLLLYGIGLGDSSLQPGYLMLAIAACAVLRGLLRYGEQLSGHYIAFKLLAVLRDKVFHALRRLAPAKLEGRDKGNLIAVITTDIELLEVFYAHTIAPIVIGITTSLIMTLFIATYHSTLAWIAVAAYITVGLIIPVVTSRMAKRQGMEYRNSFGVLSSYFLESLRGMKESIQYEQGEARMQRITAMTEDLEKKQKTLKKHEGVTRALSESAVLGFSFILLLVALQLQSTGALGYSGVLIPTIALFSSFGPVVALSQLSNNLLQTFASGERLLQLLDEEETVKEVTTGSEPPFTGAKWDRINFTYDGAPVLNDIHIPVNRSRILGITGKSGSGKSTLLKLLMRFYDPQTGSVQIAGQDIRTVNTAALRNLQSYVTQDTFLFNDTIEANIRIGRANATPEQIEAAARKASVHDFIMSLPEGYQTKVGELGDRLSGGEKQRIGLARAFVREAPLMLLDEPTSNLDGFNEAVILRALNQERAGRTIVLVSHRASTMSIADEVHHIDNGRVS
ncbi:amino acid ABC transporter ATP-binding/permease protein [Paenibacillus massiliensis]|uniref:amino acid ABC transporter ATP-binding/permease protein n=1 Tax=Paenibacillus massiliensis TaxID=225917 RepID=UPI000472D262|nr:ABC transporter ATP-binding protein [Paenibacillus massiliensis]